MRSPIGDPAQSYQQSANETDKKSVKNCSFLIVNLPINSSGLLVSNQWLLVTNSY